MRSGKPSSTSAAKSATTRTTRLSGREPGLYSVLPGASVGRLAVEARARRLAVKLELWSTRDAVYEDTRQLGNLTVSPVRMYIVSDVAEATSAVRASELENAEEAPS